MKVKDLMELLKKYPEDLDVWKSSPVQGDCENVRDFLKDDLELDERYPALVIF